MDDGAELVVAEQLLQRIRCEYLEMPGLGLTCRQAQRLWGLDESMCTTLLNTLVTSKFLMQRPDGKYARATEGSVSWPRPQMAKADLVQEGVSTIDWGRRGDKAIR